MSHVEYKTAVMKSARLRIRRGTGAERGRYEEYDVQFEDGDSVLDGLVRLRFGGAPDLAFQFSCFNANVCKECAVQIDGIVEYACVAKLKAGLTHLDPVPNQHILRDLLVDTIDRDKKGSMLRHQVQSMASRKAY